jgi:hypothetical protein
MGFHTQLPARAKRITRDASGSHLSVPSTIDAQHHWLVSSNTQANQRHQHRATALSTRSGGTTWHAMIVREWLIVCAFHHAHDGSNGSLSWSQDGSSHKHGDPFPDTLLCPANGERLPQVRSPEGRGTISADPWTRRKSLPPVHVPDDSMPVTEFKHSCPLPT